MTDKSIGESTSSTVATPQFERSIGLISNFSLGFTYLSPLTAVYSLFALAITLAGPPSIWWILIATLVNCWLQLSLVKLPLSILLQAVSILGQEDFGAENMLGWQLGFTYGR